MEGEKQKSDSAASSIDGMLLDVDYLNDGAESVIRLTVKGSDGRAHELFDRRFKPYFYLVPRSRDIDTSSIFVQDEGALIQPTRIERERRSLLGKGVDALKVFVGNASHVPKLSGALRLLGDIYENDIPFAKRYSIDNEIAPLSMYRFGVSIDGGRLIIESAERLNAEPPVMNVMFFDIEVYSPTGAMPRPEKDPIIMLSYSFTGAGGPRQGVITSKPINLPFVEEVQDEKHIIKRFMELVKNLGVDIIVGYNSANFDIKYMQDRCEHIGIEFNLSRFEGDTKIERHGLVDRVKVAGIVHVDMYVVVKFISVVGAAESILKLDSKTLKNVYEAITGKRSLEVERSNIFNMWDGTDGEREMLAKYNMADSEALQKVYETLIPVMIELSRLTYDPLSDVCVSTTGQLVEFMMMHSSHKYGEIIPNKPSDPETRERDRNPIEGAYVKTPDPGIYENIAMFDFRGLYPSIIISHNIDPSNVCTECSDYYESPDGTRFDKNRKGIMPMLLKMLIDQRASVKKAYKKDPTNVFLGARSMALKIVSNSFYGYLGYARSRWYSRPCAASVTAFGREYIRKSIEAAEAAGMRVLYGDTDSVVALLGDNPKSHALEFVKGFNAGLPKSMELELEDFYTRGVFVGKKVGKVDARGAKKKYALIAEDGHIKIRGFELVRRDWSRIARDTQRAVLEAILKEGDKKRASDIVKETVGRLRDGKVPMSDVVIRTQIRKSIEGYDVKSPEVSAAKKAVKAGFKTREEVERNVIGYIITKHGESISDKAELEGMARDYDPDYYINHQVIPATMKILKELGFGEDELKGLGSQRKL